MESKPVLEVNQLSVQTCQASPSVLVNNATFSVAHDEILGIVGESGSGKSLTALSLMGLLSPGLLMSGEILFHTGDETLSILDIGQKKLRSLRGNKISMIFQDPLTALNPSKYCGDQVNEALRIHCKLPLKQSRQKVLELFHQVQLPDPSRVYTSYPFQLSGGQRQRVMIAMAMINNPDLLIADEPTTALDVSVQKSIVLLMKQLQETYHNGIIFITHDLGLITQIADRILVMQKGSIVEAGLTHEIIFNPQHTYTRGLLACRPTFSTNFKRLPVLSDFVNPVNSGFNTQIKTENLKHNDVLLKVEDLSLTYFKRKNFFTKTPIPILSKISFEVFKGETLGLVGESGSGKTTIGRSILQLIEQSQGTFLYENQNLEALNHEGRKKIRSKIQLIFQDPYSSLNPKITVGKALIEPMKVHGIGASAKQRKDRIFELLQKVGLDFSYFNRYPHELSGGQRQRIVIARALSLNPEFIICDESVSALDVSVQAQVLNLLNDLKDEMGLTYIFISHDLAVVKYMADRVIVLNQGMIQEIGPVSRVFFNPESQYTQSLISAVFSK